MATPMAANSKLGRRAAAAHIPALAALTMLAWSGPAHPVAAPLLIPLCGGGFHPIDLPGRGPAHGPDCGKACHACCERKSRVTSARRP
jgi:hypothetical protein